MTSMAETHRVMVGQWSRCPHLAEPSCGEVVSCQMHMLGSKRALCVKLNVDGIPFTLVAANATDLRLPDVPPITRGTTRYFIQTFGETSMVTTERDGLWLCIIGQRSPDRLMEIVCVMTGAASTKK